MSPSAAGHGISIRWLLLGVAGASLVLPLAVLLALRSMEPLLVRETERELNVQGALIVERVRELEGVAEPAGDSAFRPHPTTIRDLSEPVGPVPTRFPFRSVRSNLSGSPEALGQLSQWLRRAQVHNLSGVRVLDGAGCVVASTRGQLDRCLGQLPEIQAALAGKRRAVIRERNSDEPPPAWGSISRRSDLRVFVALPIVHQGRAIGAVWLSRTSESSLEWLFKQRRDLFYLGLIAMGLVAFVSLSSSLLITRPLARMQLLLARGRAPALRQVSAPREIHALGEALAEAAERLEARSRYVADFAANVSHELKTPLTSIRGAVELLTEQHDHMSAEQRSRFLANIDAATRRTERLVERLLLLARLENAVEDDQELVPVASWLRGWTARFGAEVDLRVAGDVENFRLSELELESILGNLVDNALRYRRRKPVSVELARSDDGVAIQVSDDGPGIPDSHRARLFERFFTTERDAGGTGLGLAIVRAIAERRGGHAGVDSDETGTRVRVQFPVPRHATPGE